MILGEMMKFYHGSKDANITKLTTHHSKDGYVYATSSRLVALTYAARRYPNLFFSQNGRECFLEIKPNLFEIMTKGKSAYIYTLEQKNFSPVLQNNACGHQHCFKVNEDVCVIGKKYIHDVYNELMKYKARGQFKIIHYNEIDEETKNNVIQLIKERVKKLDKQTLENQENFWYLFLD